MTTKALTFTRSVDQWLDWAEGSMGYSDETIKSYRWTMDLTMRILGAETDPRSVVREDLEHCLGRWTVSNSTKAIRISTWRSYFKWLAERQGCSNPAIDMERPKKQTPVRKRIAPREFEAILDACDRDLDRLLILTLGHTGIRISEFLALEWRDIDFGHGAHGELIVRSGKGKKGRAVPLTPRLSEFLLSYQPVHADPYQRLCKWGKSNARKRITLLADRAGYYGPIGPHDFRRFLLREYTAKRKDIREAQQIAGHADIKTTQKYTGAVDESVIREGMGEVFGESDLVEAIREARRPPCGTCGAAEGQLVVVKGIGDGHQCPSCERWVIGGDPLWISGTS